MIGQNEELTKGILPFYHLLTVEFYIKEHGHAKATIVMGSNYCFINPDEIRALLTEKTRVTFNDELKGAILLKMILLSRWMQRRTFTGLLSLILIKNMIT
ncbi:MAG: hypothetical protein NTX61_16700 [Bacteroidetes bacterium]|nr:hypothetical protein [Bacteroidota bacterium]